MNVTANDVIMAELVSLALEELRNSEDMASYQTAAMSAVNQALTLATQTALEIYDNELYQTKDKEMISKGKEKRELLELFGEMTFCRRRYTYKGRNIYLLDEVLGFPSNTAFSASVIRFLAMHARTDAYESATEDLKELSGTKVSRSSVKAAIAATADALRRQTKESSSVKKKVPFIDIESDDIVVPRQRTKKQKEQDRCLGRDKDKAKVTLTVVKGYEGKERTGFGKRKRCLNSFFITGALGTEEAFERTCDYLEKHYDTSCISHVHFGSDTASNQRIGRDILPKKVIDSVDTYHAFRKLEKLLEADVKKEIVKSLYKEEYQNIYEILINAFEFYKETKQYTLAENLCEAAGYLNRNAEAIVKGLKHSLGTIEGANAHIVKDRCKGRGRSWSLEGADNITVLNAAYAQKIAFPYIGRKQCLPRLAQVIEQSKTSIITDVKQHKVQLSGNHYYHQTKLIDCERTKGTNTSSLA